MKPICEHKLMTHHIFTTSVKSQTDSPSIVNNETPKQYYTRND